MRIRSFSHSGPSARSLTMNVLCAKWRISTFGFLQPSQGSLLSKHLPSPPLSHKGFNPCTRGILLQWATRALVCLAAVCWMLSSHVRKLILCGCGALSPRKTGTASIPFTLSTRWVQWERSNLTRPRNRSYFYLLYHLKQCAFLSKVLQAQKDYRT